MFRQLYKAGSRRLTSRKQSTENKLATCLEDTKELLKGKTKIDFANAFVEWKRMSLLAAEKELNIVSASYVANTIDMLGVPLTDILLLRLSKTLTTAAFTSANGSFICPVASVVLKSEQAANQILIKTTDLLNNLRFKEDSNELSELSWYMLLATQLQIAKKGTFFKRDKGEKHLNSLFHESIKKILSNSDDFVEFDDIKDTTFRLLHAFYIIHDSDHYVGHQIVNTLLTKVLNNHDIDFNLLDLKHTVTYLNSMSKRHISWTVFDGLSTRMEQLDQTYNDFDILRSAVFHHPKIGGKGSSDIVLFCCKLFAEVPNLTQQVDVVLNFLFRISEFKTPMPQEVRKMIGFGYHPKHKITAKLFRRYSSLLTPTVLNKIEKAQQLVLQQALSNVIKHHGLCQELRQADFTTYSVEGEKSLLELCQSSVLISSNKVTVFESQKKVIQAMTKLLNRDNNINAKTQLPFSKFLYSISSFPVMDAHPRAEGDYYKKFLKISIAIASKQLDTMIDERKNKNPEPMRNKNLFDLIYVSMALCKLVRKQQHSDSNYSKSVSGTVDDVITQIEILVMSTGEWSENCGMKNYLTIVSAISYEISWKLQHREPHQSAERILKHWLKTCPVLWDAPEILIATDPFTFSHFARMFRFTQGTIAGLSLHMLLVGVRFQLSQLVKRGERNKAEKIFSDVVSAIAESKVTDGPGRKLSSLVGSLCDLWQLTWDLKKSIGEVKSLIPMFDCHHSDRRVFEKPLGYLTSKTFVLLRNRSLISIYIPHLANLWYWSSNQVITGETNRMWEFIYPVASELAFNKAFTSQCASHIVNVYGRCGKTIENDTLNLFESCTNILIGELGQTLPKERQPNVDYVGLLFSYSTVSETNPELYNRLESIIVRDRIALRVRFPYGKLAKFYSEINYQSKLWVIKEKSGTSQEL